MKIVLFSGSLRKDSLNKKFVQAAADIAGTLGEHERIVLDLKSLNMPVYDGDLEANGIPKSFVDFDQQIKAADAVVISSPEYNASIASSLKTLLDWTSRIKPSGWKQKHVLLLSATPGALGGVRGLLHSRQTFTELGTFLYPETMGLPKAHEAFDPSGGLKDEKIKEKLKSLLENFLEHASS